jgi:phage terminase large subunit-like protein
MDEAGNMKAGQGRSRSNRIDGIVASLMALGRVIANDENAGAYRVTEFAFV